MSGLVHVSRAFSNGEVGISTPTSGVVSTCRAAGNGTDGIDVDNGVVTACLGRFNADNGIQATSSLVMGNTAISNTGANLNAQFGVTVHNHTP